MTFQTTRWSLVFRVGGGGETSRLALAELCQAYWSPVHGFFRRAARGAEDALDLTQGLFARLLEREDFAAASPERGRFRNWLLACARHHLEDVRAAVQAEKRGGRVSLLPIDGGLGGVGDGDEPIDPAATPEQVFAQRWVRALLDRAETRLRQENEERGRGRVFAAARVFLDGEGAADGSPMRASARQLGMTEGAFKVAVHRLRDRLRELVVDEVRQTIDDPAEAPAELAFLLGQLERKKT